MTEDKVIKDGSKKYNSEKKNVSRQNNVKDYESNNGDVKIHSKEHRNSFFDFKKGDRFYNKSKGVKFFKVKINYFKDRINSKDRISKRLAMLGVSSRREAEKMVLDGKVKINGIICKDLSFLVSYEDKISVNNKEILNKPIRTKIYTFNKPSGYVTTNNDPQGRKTIFELIPSRFGRLITIGRLDMNTEGLLLLTNNGELARIMEMPATALKRIYYAKVIGNIDEKMKERLEDLRNGIKIEGVEYGKMIVEVESVSPTSGRLKIIIFEGKNNEIRRIMWHLGLKVVKLTRVQYGDFKLFGLPSGCISESRMRVDMTSLERRASINAKRYNEKMSRTKNQKSIQENNNDIIDEENIDNASFDVECNDNAVDNPICCDNDNCNIDVCGDNNYDNSCENDVNGLNNNDVVNNCKDNTNSNCCEGCANKEDDEEELHCSDDCCKTGDENDICDTEKSDDNNIDDQKHQEDRDNGDNKCNE